MIVFVHLLNDHSGSPQILRSAIFALSNKCTEMRLFVGSGGVGCLDTVGIPTTRYWYRRTPFRLLTLFTYMASQIILIIRLLSAKDIPQNASIYVNTLLPFGAALYGRWTGRKVVYHLHEVSISPAPLKWFLTTVAQHTSHQLIYVSEDHRARLPIKSVPSAIIYNALDNGFLNQANASRYMHRRDGKFSVLMLASLRDYKGIPELITLAKRLTSRTDIHFDLVVNDDVSAIRSYSATHSIPDNLLMHPCTNAPEEFYAQSSLVLNLSRPDVWIETFGMTILEAMAFGIPTIVPPVGGPTELVSDGIEGFWIDCRNEELLLRKVQELADKPDLCIQISDAARARSQFFSQKFFAQSLLSAI